MAARPKAKELNLRWQYWRRLSRAHSIQVLMESPEIHLAAADIPGEVGARSARGMLASGAAGVLGLAPHVLHHVGPVAGAALLAGASGKLLFGAIGFLLMIPMLWRMRRRTGAWRAPALALGAFATVFVISTALIGPLIAGGDNANDSTMAPDEHEVHHK